MRPVALWPPPCEADRVVDQSPHGVFREPTRLAPSFGLVRQQNPAVAARNMYESTATQAKMMKMKSALLFEAGPPAVLQQPEAGPPAVRETPEAAAGDAIPFHVRHRRVQRDVQSLVAVLAIQLPLHHK